MDVKFCLVFPREALSVPVMRHVLGDALLNLGADDEAVSDLLLAVTEACTNVVRHGGPGDGYEVVAMVDRAGCVIEVLNTGPGIDPKRVPGVRVRRPLWPSVPLVVRIRRRSARSTARPPVSRPLSSARHHRGGARERTGEQAAALPESGRGLAIMQACVDGVTLSSGTERGTVVSLQKRITWRPDAPLVRLPAGQLRDAG